MFRSPWIDHDCRDLNAQKQVLRDAFDGHTEWKIPELLDAATRDPRALLRLGHPPADLAPWAGGFGRRFGVLRVPLSGRGTSLARTGAWLLAEALSDLPDDVATAFDQYRARAASPCQLPTGHRWTRRRRAGPGHPTGHRCPQSTTARHRGFVMIAACVIAV